MEVVGYEKIEGGGSRLALVKIRIPEWRLVLTVNLCRAKNGHCFIGYPSRMVEDGQKAEWVPYVQFDKEADKRFQKSALDAIDKYCEKNGR